MMNKQNMVVDGWPMHILTPEEIDERNEMVLAYYKDKPEKYYERY